MNLPFANILGPYTGPDGKEMPQGAVKTPELLQKLFADRGVDMKKPFTTSCGTGTNVESMPFNVLFQNDLNTRSYSTFFKDISPLVQIGSFSVVLMWSEIQCKLSRTLGQLYMYESYLGCTVLDRRIYEISNNLLSVINTYMLTHTHTHPHARTYM